MPFFKQTECKDAAFKYGFSQKGIFALERIKRGEAIFTCDLSICDYLLIENVKSGKTRQESLEMFKKYPDSAQFMHMYSYMVDDDLFDWPRGFVTQELHEDCMYFNHSCDPNCGFQSLDSALVVALRDIEIGEELTYDYQCMDSEASFYAGLNCKCGTDKCRGVLSFDHYRNVDWQNALYEYSGAYVKRKIDELKTKWSSARCVLKYYFETTDGSERQYGLTVFKRVRKDELVAMFSDPNNIKPSSHYLRHSVNPTCYLLGTKVYASDTYEPDVELTLNYEALNSTREV